ncbi:MAG: O-succinylbenzoate synthase [Subtercola sp.]|nr:O-succinylbenzoate synthase [Subtercola sp.]
MVPIPPTNPLIAAAAECPTAVFGARTIAGQQHRPDPRILPGVVKCTVQLVDGMRTKGVSHLRPVECDAGDLAGTVVVVGDVGHRLGARREHPFGGVEDLGDERCFWGHVFSQIARLRTLETRELAETRHNGGMASTHRPLPTLTELLEQASVVSIPLNTRFRGVDAREAVILRGPEGATEFSPFVEYDDVESLAWLAGAVDFGWVPTPAPLRDRIAVNATLPAVSPAEVERVLARYPGCRTIKVKVAERGQTLDDDLARVREARAILGSEGRIRLDANGGWNVGEAEKAIHALAEFDLEYVEQPCPTVDDLWEIRQRVKYMGIPIAADESVRKVDDPLEVARRAAADVLVIKAQPLGGIHSALDIAERAGLPVVVSSALDTSIGIAMGAHLAASIPNLEYDCGLATAALLTVDVTAEPLIPVGGSIPVVRPLLDESLVQRVLAAPDRDAWWRDRLTRVYGLLLELSESNGRHAGD